MEDTVEESVDQSVETDDTPSVEESTSQVEASGAEDNETPEAKEEKPAPFHEHPRFKELISQNQGFKSQIDEYRGALDRLNQQMETMRTAQTPKKEEPKDQFLVDLEKVNPAYAKSLENIYQQAAKANEIEKRLQAYETQQFQEKALGRFNNLMAENKIADPMDQRLYKAAVREVIVDLENSGKKLTINDMEKIFQDFHKDYSKYREEATRKQLAGYVQDKTKDKTPKSTTGGVPSKPGTKKLAANDFAGQAKWLAEQIKSMKKEH